MHVHKFTHHSSDTAHAVADARHDVCQSQDPCGFQGARAAKYSKKDGSALLASRRHCAHGPVALDADVGAEPFLHIGGHVRLALLCTKPTIYRWLVVTSTVALCRRLIVANVHFLVRQHALQLWQLYSCLGCPRRHHAGGSTLRSPALMSWLRPARESPRMEGLPTTSMRPCGHGSKRRAACAQRREIGVLYSRKAALRCHDRERGERGLHEKHSPYHRQPRHATFCLHANRSGDEVKVC